MTTSTVSAPTLAWSDLLQPHASKDWEKEWVRGLWRLNADLATLAKDGSSSLTLMLPSGRRVTITQRSRPDAKYGWRESYTFEFSAEATFLLENQDPNWLPFDQEVAGPHATTLYYEPDYHSDRYWADKERCGWNETAYRWEKKLCKLMELRDWSLDGVRAALIQRLKATQSEGVVQVVLFQQSPSFCTKGRKPERVYMLSAAKELEALGWRGVPVTEFRSLDSREAWRAVRTLRRDPVLAFWVASFGELGVAVYSLDKGDSTLLKVVEVPSDVKWHINGREAVVEDHREWA